MLAVTYNYWARQFALAACWTLFWGGIWGLGYEGFQLVVAIYAIVVSIIIFPFAWAFTFLKGFLIITQKFLVVGLICAALSILPFFLIATHLGGICLAFAALLYLLAWTNREKPIPRSELEKGTFRWI